MATGRETGDRWGAEGQPPPVGQNVAMKAKFDDRVITVGQIVMSDGRVIPPGMHGFVTETFEAPVEEYEVEFYVESEREPQAG
jgi:hypothetical protein